MIDRVETERELTITRLLDAPRELVFQAWTDPAHLHWFLNDSAPAPREPIEVDLRVGGAWRLKMVIDEDTEYFTGGVYREIVPGEKLVFSWGAVDGWPKIDMDRLDESPVATVILNEIDGKTEMIFHFALPAHLSEVQVQEWFDMGIRAGWDITIQRLVATFNSVPSTS